MKLTSLGAILASAVLACVGVSGAQDPERDSSAFNDRPLVRVPSEADILAQTDVEVELAKRYDLLGRQLGPAPRPLSPLEAFLEKASARQSDGLAPIRYDSEAAERRGQVCNADMILIGRPVAHRSFLSASKTAMVTAYEIGVESWILPTSGVPRIVVGELGGKVLVGEHLYETLPTDTPISLSLASLLLLREGGIAHRVIRKAPIASGRLDVVGLEGAAESVEKQLRDIAETCGDY